jgi:hypothetical protein
MSELVSYALTTVAKVKTYLGISVSTDDTLLERLINFATDFIEEYCQRRFFKTIYEEIYDGDGFDGVLYLNQYPVTEIIKIEQNDGTTDNPNWTRLNEGEDYEKYLNEGKIYFYNQVKGKRNYKITYEAGYTIIPHDLEGLCQRLVGRLYEKRQSEGHASEGLGPVNITWGKFIDDEDRLILERYKKVSI